MTCRWCESTEHLGIECPQRSQYRAISPRKWTPKRQRYDREKEICKNINHVKRALDKLMELGVEPEALEEIFRESITKNVMEG